MDVYEPGPGGQLHDLNPSPTNPTGLFWTTAIPDNSIAAHLGEGAAKMEVSGAQVLDHGNIVNALVGGGPPPVPASVSFKVVWSGVNKRLQVRNTTDGHAGEFVQNVAQMEWTATIGDLRLTSDPLATSSSSFAEIGHERNGSFFF